MRPDPEQEQRWQAHIAERLADAPEPEPQRLAAALERARRQAGRARRARRLGAWAAAGLLAGSAAAGVGWWRAADEPKTGGRTSSAPEARAAEPSETAPVRSQDASSDSKGGKRDAQSGKTAERRPARERSVDDNPVIYRRSR